MENIYDDYSFEIELMEKSLIRKKDIDEYLLRLLLKIIKEIKNKKRNELDIGDIYPIAILNAKTVFGYKLDKKVERFFNFLGDYKEDPFDSGKLDKRYTLKNIEREALKLLKEVKE